MEKERKNLFSVVFAKDKEDRTEEKAEALAKKIDAAEGIACFTRPQTGEKYWGILVGLHENVKKDLTKEKAKEENE